MVGMDTNTNEYDYRASGFPFQNMSFLFHENAYSVLWTFFLSLIFRFHVRLCRRWLVGPANPSKQRTNFRAQMLYLPKHALGG